jgi:uncharacterized cupin superfamily protein
MDATTMSFTLVALLFILISSVSSFAPNKAFVLTATSSYNKQQIVLLLSMSTETAARPNIEVVSQPDQAFLENKGVFNWGTWGCGVSKFPWTYDQSESCYLLAGKVTVAPNDGRPPASFGKGDFVSFPAGMSCTWDVTETVNKHYMFY